MANAKNAAKSENLCYDCRKEIKVKDGKLVGGVYLAYKNGQEEYRVVKCSSCFEKNKALTAFQPCEVYSRIVGYIRPVQQWNAGKVQEYGDRREFQIENK